MGYRIMGRAHAAALWARGRLAGAAGQGTVEYVALILLVAGLFATVVLAAGGVKGKGIADAVTEKIRTTIEGVAAQEGLSAAAGGRAAAPGAYHGAVASRTADPRARPIAVFDSGVGGLTVLHELLVQLPHEDFLYLADAARLPYGTRTQAELERFALQCAEELLARGAKLLVVACNSATAAALPALRERMAQTTLGIDVLGVVQPGAVQAVAATTNGRVGLLATPATVASGAYASAIAQADPFVDLTAVACPDLTAIIEGGFPFDERVVETVRGYVAPLRAAGVDTVILGCTHYPLIAPMLQRMLGRGVRIVTSGAPVAHQVEHVLGAARARQPARRRGRLPLPDHRRRRGLPRARVDLPAAPARRGRARHAARGGGGGMSERSYGRAARRAAPGDHRAGLRGHRDRLGAR